MHINCQASYLREQILTVVGVRSGLALTAEEFRNHLEAGVERYPHYREFDWWTVDPDDLIRVEATAVERSYVLLLNQLGVINDVRLMMEYFMHWALSHASPDDYALLQMMTTSRDSDGPIGIPEKLFPVFVEVMKRSLYSPSGLPKVMVWDTTIPLSDLFRSEHIPAAASPDFYFDQRFIDYLAADPNRLESMHWRQFEYMCGEWFARQNYAVEITPGRNDRGIDVYARREDSESGPELVIVQAKRYAGTNMVSINDVKALYYDLSVTKATRAVIATTTRVAPGGIAICDARTFEIQAYERRNVESWLSEMRTQASPGVISHVSDQTA